MEKNKVYISMFILLFVLVILLGVVNMLSGALTKKNEPTIKVTPTTDFAYGESAVRQPTQALSVNGEVEIPEPKDSEIHQAKNLSYPLKFGNLIIDYLPNKNLMTIYYPVDRQLAQKTFEQFLINYEGTSSAQLKYQQEYIGLVKDPSEPQTGAQ